MSSDHLPAWHQALLDAYGDRLPDRLAELDAALDAAQRGEDGAIGALHAAVHRLHGSAGTYGHPKLAEQLAVWERLLEDGDLDQGKAWMKRLRESVGAPGGAAAD